MHNLRNTKQYAIYVILKTYVIYVIQVDNVIYNTYLGSLLTTVPCLPLRPSYHYTLCCCEAILPLHVPYLGNVLTIVVDSWSREAHDKMAFNVIRWNHLTTYWTFYIQKQKKQLTLQTHYNSRTVNLNINPFLTYHTF